MARSRETSRIVQDGCDIILFDSAASYSPNTIGDIVKYLLSASEGVVDAFTGMIPGVVSDADKTANLAALQANVNLAASRNVPLLIPRKSGEYRVNGSVNIPDGGIDIISDNGVIFSTADAPVFVLMGGCEFHVIAGFKTIHELTTTPTAACSLKFASTDNTKFTQYNRFSIKSYGALATYINDSTPRITSFGPESNVAWNWFEDDANFPFTNVARNVYWFKKGSGTGNTFTGTKGRLTSSSSDAGASAFFRFEGAGYVVGDIVIDEYHLGASDTADCAVIEVTAGALYRTNVSLYGQADAGMTRIFRLNGQNFVDISHEGPVGGGAIIGIDAPIKTMRIHDRGEGSWSTGIDWSTDATGSTSIQVARVKLKGGAFVDVGGAMVTLNITGLVGGVSFGTSEIKIPLRLNSPATAVVADTPVVVAAGPSGIFGVSVAISGLTATISITMTPTNTGSNGHVNVVANGDNFSLERL